MELILTINPDNITIEGAGSFRTRSAARGVVFDDQNNVALLPVTAHQYYKLPGGGIEEGEDKIKAFRRECLEEIGSNIEVIQELGSIVEYKTEFGLVQTSYCYVAKVIGEKKKASFTQHELEEGFEEAVWVPLDEAVKLMDNQTDNYQGKFVVERDAFILKKVRELGF